MIAVTPPPVKSPDAGAVRSGAVTAVVCVALAAVVAAMSSLNVALPEIARSTHATQTQLAWIIDAYSLVFASLLLPAGAFGDRYGRRLALLATLTLTSEDRDRDTQRAALVRYQWDHSQVPQIHYEGFLAGSVTRKIDLQHDAGVHPQRQDHPSPDASAASSPGSINSNVCRRWRYSSAF